MRPNNDFNPLLFALDKRLNNTYCWLNMSPVIHFLWLDEIIVHCAQFASLENLLGTTAIHVASRLTRLSTADDGGGMYRVPRDSSSTAQ